MTRPARCHEDGSVLLLVLGVVVLLGLLVTVVVDAAHLCLARRSLEAVTDGAALAGAQAVDLDAVYAGRTRSTTVPLDPVAVRSAVTTYLEASEAGRAVPGFAVTSVVTRDATVTVAARATVRLPFVGAITGGRTTVVIRAASTAQEIRTG